MATESVLAKQDLKAYVMSTINIEVTSFNLREVRDQAIRTLIEKHPGEKMSFYSKSLGLAEAHFYKLNKKLKFIVDRKRGRGKKPIVTEKTIISNGRIKKIKLC